MINYGFIAQFFASLINLFDSHLVYFIALKLTEKKIILIDGGYISTFVVS